MKQYYRIPKLDMIYLQYIYENEVEVVESEHEYTLVKLSDSQYEDLVSTEIQVFRA